MRTRGLSIVVGVILVVVYGVRMTTGINAGIAYARGAPLAREGNYAQALPFLDRSAVGGNRFDALWLASEVRVGLCDVPPGDTSVDVQALLTAADHGYMQALRTAPASAWPWGGLAWVYNRREAVERSKRVQSLERLTDSPWARVGTDGRVAIGMIRCAIDRAPNLFSFRDQLALMLLDYGLEDAALGAVRESAKVQPVYATHSYRFRKDLPAKVLDAFVDGSKAVLGKTPFLSRQRHLISLGKLEQRRGDLDQAEGYLKAALKEPCDAVGCAEAAFVLGSVLLAKKEYAEAEKNFRDASAHPTFETAATSALVRVAEETGRGHEALRLLQELRRKQPTVMSYALRFAQLARRLRDWPAAIEALRWTILIHPSEPQPRVSLVQTYLEAGDLAKARQALRDLRDLVGETADVVRLRDALTGTSAPQASVANPPRPEAASPLGSGKE